MKPRAPVSGRLLLLVASLAMVGALLTAPTSRAAFVDTTGNTANSAAAANCFYAPIVQSGTATNSADGTQTVTISSVDPTKAFLIFTSRHDSNRPVGSVLGGQIASATSIEFVRNTNEAPPAAIDIRWYVVEYSCGVSVQRGTVGQTATTVDVAITPVAALSQAFVTYSKTTAATDTQWGAGDSVVVDLSSTSNVQVRSQAATGGHTIYWQVVEFTDPTKIAVQRGTTSMAIGTTTANVTLATSVDTTTTFPMVSSQAGDQDLDETLMRARLLSSTSLEIARIYGDLNDVDEISWQIVELFDGTAVQHFNTLLNPGTASTNIAISSVDLGRATAFTGSQSGSGQNAGRTTYFGDDVVGVASATFSFNSSTQVAIDRTSTVDFGSFGWQVVEWGS